jgi:hypothetical protein
MCVKSKAIVPLSIHGCLDLILDLDKRCLYDEHFDSGELLQALPLNTSIYYLKNRKIMIVSPRDFIIIQKIFKIKNKWYIVAHSIDLHGDTSNKTNSLQKDGFVRANMLNQVWRIKRLTAMSCRVTYASECDLKVAQFLAK